MRLRSNHQEEEKEVKKSTKKKSKSPTKKSKKKSPEKNNWEHVLSLEKTTENLFPELTKEETKRVKAMFDACKNIDEHKDPENAPKKAKELRKTLPIKDNLSIPWTCHSINKLKSGQWLDDEIINGFISDNLNDKGVNNFFFPVSLFTGVLLFFINEVDMTIEKNDSMEQREQEVNEFKMKLTEKKSKDLIEKLSRDENKSKAFDTKFIRYTNKHTKNVSIQDKQKLFFPLNIDGNHWILAVVFVQQGIIGYFDSFNNEETMRRYNPFLLRYLKIIFKDKDDWITTLIESPKQTNSCDCGVFLCANLYYLSKNKMPNFSKKDIPKIRNFMAHFYFKQPVIPKKSSPKKTSPKTKIVIDLMNLPVSHKVIEINDGSAGADESEKNTFRNLFNNNNLVYFRKIKLKNGTEIMNENTSLDKNVNRITTHFSPTSFYFNDIIEYHITGQIHRIYNSTTRTWSSSTA